MSGMKSLQTSKIMENGKRNETNQIESFGPLAAHLSPPSCMKPRRSELLARLQGVAIARHTSSKNTERIHTDLNLSKHSNIISPRASRTLPENDVEQFECKRARCIKDETTSPSISHSHGVGDVASSSGMNIFTTQSSDVDSTVMGISEPNRSSSFGRDEPSSIQAEVNKRDTLSGCPLFTRTHRTNSTKRNLAPKLVLRACCISFCGLIVTILINRQIFLSRSMSAQFMCSATSEMTGLWASLTVMHILCLLIASAWHRLHGPDVRRSRNTGTQLDTNVLDSKLYLQWIQQLYYMISPLLCTRKHPSVKDETTAKHDELPDEPLETFAPPNIRRQTPRYGGYLHNAVADSPQMSISLNEMENSSSPRILHATLLERMQSDVARSQNSTNHARRRTISRADAPVNTSSKSSSVNKQTRYRFDILTITAIYAAACGVLIDLMGLTNQLTCVDGTWPTELLASALSACALGVGTAAHSPQSEPSFAQTKSHRSKLPAPAALSWAVWGVETFLSYAFHIVRVHRPSGSHVLELSMTIAFGLCNIYWCYLVVHRLAQRVTGLSLFVLALLVKVSSVGLLTGVWSAKMLSLASFLNVAVVGCALFPLCAGMSIEASKVARAKTALSEEIQRTQRFVRVTFHETRVPSNNAALAIEAARDTLDTICDMITKRYAQPQSQPGRNCYLMRGSSSADISDPESSYEFSGTDVSYSHRNNRLHQGSRLAHSRTYGCNTNDAHTAFFPPSYIPTNNESNNHETDWHVEQQLCVTDHDLNNEIEDLRMLLDSAHSSHDRMAGVMNSVLELVRLQKGFHSLCMKEFNLVAVFEEVCRTFAPSFRRANIAYKWNTVGSLDQRTGVKNLVKGDSAKISQALSNLLSNAQKYTPANETVTAWLEMQEVTDQKHSAKHTQTNQSSSNTRTVWARLSVKDTGRGMTDEEQQLVFQPFSRLHTAEEGTGLGLNISALNMKAHGGSIEVFSKGVGHGTTFCIHVPLEVVQTTSESDPVADICAPISDCRNPRPFAGIESATTSCSSPSVSNSPQRYGNNTRPMYDMLPSPLRSMQTLPHPIAAARSLSPDSVWSDRTLSPCEAQRFLSPFFVPSGYSKTGNYTKSIDESYIKNDSASNISDTTSQRSNSTVWGLSDRDLTATFQSSNVTKELCTVLRPLGEYATYVDYNGDDNKHETDDSIFQSNENTEENTDEHVSMVTRSSSNTDQHEQSVARTSSLQYARRADEVATRTCSLQYVRHSNESATRTSVKHISIGSEDDVHSGSVSGNKCSSQRQVSFESTPSDNAPRSPHNLFEEANGGGTGITHGLDYLEASTTGIQESGIDTLAVRAPGAYGTPRCVSPHQEVLAEPHRVLSSSMSTPLCLAEEAITPSGRGASDHEQTTAESTNSCSIGGLTSRQLSNQLQTPPNRPRRQRTQSFIEFTAEKQSLSHCSTPSSDCHQASATCAPLIRRHKSYSVCSPKMINSAPGAPNVTAGMMSPGLPPVHSLVRRHISHETAYSVRSEGRVPASDNGISVLVVDDDGTTRILMSRLLRRNPQVRQVTLAVDGQEAVEIVNREGIGAFDVITMDKEMPRMDGWEASQALRKLGFNKTIVGVTGNAGADDRSRFHEAGADHVVVKPISKAMLWDAICFK